MLYYSGCVPEMWPKMQEEQENLLCSMLDCPQCLSSGVRDAATQSKRHPETCSKIRDVFSVPAGSARAAPMLVGEETLCKSPFYF